MPLTTMAAAVGVHRRLAHEVACVWGWVDPRVPHMDVVPLCCVLSLLPGVRLTMFRVFSNLSCCVVV